ncbi:MAG: DUF4911 domain-containing protein [Deltaproteobacteria bacterium]|nr:DUF4911 domain-containing protein [Deltaproteobacteria bacterium]NIS76660.1 DUF4911 domain-containing protein [Deltaproteobacteria bacterium]
MNDHVYYAKVKKKDIAYIRFIFEGYDNIGNVRTLDSVRGYIEFVISRDFDEDFHAIIRALKESVFLELIERPDGYESIADCIQGPDKDASKKYS